MSDFVVGSFTDRSRHFSFFLRQQNKKRISGLCTKVSKPLKSQKRSNCVHSIGTLVQMSIRQEGKSFPYIDYAKDGIVVNITPTFLYVKEWSPRDEEDGVQKVDGFDPVYHVMVTDVWLRNDYSRSSPKCTDLIQTTLRVGERIKMNIARLSETRNEIFSVWQGRNAETPSFLVEEQRLQLYTKDSSNLLEGLVITAQETDHAHKTPPENLSATIVPVKNVPRNLLMTSEWDFMIEDQNPVRLNCYSIFYQPIFEMERSF